jgi:hypothetical protein
MALRSFLLIVAFASLALCAAPNAANQNNHFNFEEDEGTLVNPQCWIPKGRSHCAPFFVIIGSMKCGTTSLYSYLLNHPQVLPINSGARLGGRPIIAEKEVRFFIEPSWSKLMNSVGIEKAYTEYFDIFPPIAPSNEFQVITGEASPMYVV